MPSSWTCRNCKLNTLVLDSTKDWFVLSCYEKSVVDVITRPLFRVYSNGIDLTIEVNKNPIKAQNLTTNTISSVSGNCTNTHPPSFSDKTVDKQYEM